MDKECEAEFDKLKVEIAKLNREVTKLKKAIDTKLDADEFSRALD